MKLLKNSKISYKLILSFILVSLFIVGVGLIGMQNMKKISNNATSMYEDSLQSLDALNTIKGNSLQLQTQFYLLVYSKDSSKLAETKDLMDRLKTQNNTLLDKFGKLNLDSNEKKLLNDYNNTLAQYRDARDKVVKLVEGGKYDEAVPALTESAKIRASMSDTLDKLIQYNVSQASDANTSNINVSNKSNVLIVVSTIVGFLFALVCGISVSTNISKRLKKVESFAHALGDGDLSKSIEITSNDEIGSLANSLNNAVQNTKYLISELSSSAQNISSSSEELSATMQELSSKMLTVNESTMDIAKGAQDLSATTEEINASSEQIGDTTYSLADKAKEALNSVKAIEIRALNIKEKASKAITEGNEIYKKQETDINNAIKESKVVNEIKELASSIGDIAEQTNLLALNAAIEAARAGETGKGFAVVADEVRKLAEESAESVKNIQEMVTKIDIAVNNLSSSGQSMLQFMTDYVQPTYELLMDTGKQYELDAEFIASISEQIASGSKSMSETIEQVTSAIETVAATAEESAAGSDEIMNSISETTFAIEEVSKAAQSQAMLAENLNKMTSRFKL
ncbi:methyl-accepting chemotaxis protein [Clostridium paridis]|uniref:Methyl-accepting chemotaxis protein n=1 Tax=Clostridium paridis TaxID=2803863 RepID=A0A937FGB1_9CLOT|nr:methyl-accepting chemotaxis protein [Clostridium paridis]MBL4931488.1 methyl-accepting chemotaxis protein [Clostridium paridis]